MDRLLVSSSRGLDCGVSFDIIFADSTLIYKSRKSQSDSHIKIGAVIADSLHLYADKTFDEKRGDTSIGAIGHDGMFANIYGYYSDGRKDSLIFLDQDGNDDMRSLKKSNPHFYRLFTTLVQIKGDKYCWSLEEGILVSGRN